MKIALSFLRTINIDIISILSCLQTQLNNFLNAFIKRLSNKIVHNFKIRKTIFETLFTKNILDFKLELKQDTSNAIFFVNAHIKIK